MMSQIVYILQVSVVFEFLGSFYICSQFLVSFCKRSFKNWMGSSYLTRRNGIGVRYRS